MLKIALCDDDAVFLKELTGKIQELLRFEEKNAAIASFVNPTALTASVASGDRFDIFILDVEMPQIDGFKVAADLRKYQPNVALIFLTSHLQYAPEGYKVDALRFISKLNVDETLPEALQKALHTLEQQDQHSLLVQHYKNFSRVLYQNIIYVRKTARSVQIITSNQGVIKDNRGIKELFGISIFLLSPIRSTKHPLSERLYAQNKKAARIIVSIDFLLFLILYITGMPTRYLATWALSLSAVAIMMVITLFKKNSTRRESV